MKQIIFPIIKEYINEEKWMVLSLIVLSIIINVIQTKGLSSMIANIIESIHDSNKKTTYKFYGYFVLLSIVFGVFNYLYTHIEINLLVNMRLRIRQDLFSIALKTNNENLSDVNFVSLYTPILRIAHVYFLMFTSFISMIFPAFVFLIVIFSFFIYTLPVFGICFSFSNILIFLNVIYYWKEMVKKNNEYETTMIDTESNLLELLNNTDKIIQRGETVREIKNFKDLTKKTVDKAETFYIFTNNITGASKGVLFIIIFVSLLFFINQFYNKKIDAVLLITLISILILYRDRMDLILDQVDDLVESNGRAEAVSKFFKNIVDNYDSTLHNKYDPIELNFEKITFENVYFKYESASEDSYIFKNVNVTLKTTGNKIIGIHGNSGKGKSTFVKLIMKLYTLTDGKIFIDDKDISKIDADYIRKNIIYINQSGKLFDIELIQNMLYGCEEENIDLCRERLNTILKYEKLKGLYGNMDMETAKCGSLGENLSGGQRQIANVISGLIHPAKVLILDEPTNALDPELKTELLGLIKEFKKYKECIIIITHDSAVYPIFDEVLDL